MHPSNYFIRPARNTDIMIVKEIVFQVLTEYGLAPDEYGKDKDLNDIETNYFSSNGFFGVVVHAATWAVAGTFGLMRISPAVCELRKMYLLKPARGIGLGRLMLETALDIAKEKKYEKIILETITPLKEAIALYRKFGFEETIPQQVNQRVDQAFQLVLNQDQ